MYADHIDRIDLCRLADDGCPHDLAGDAGAQDLSELWGSLCKDDQDRR